MVHVHCAPIAQSFANSLLEDYKTPKLDLEF